MPYKPIDDWKIEPWATKPCRFYVTGPDGQDIGGPDEDGDFSFEIEDEDCFPLYVHESVLRAMLAKLDEARAKENG